MVKFRNIDSHIPTSKFRTTKDDMSVGSIKVDTMTERTSGSGVTIENVLLKDGNISLGDGFSLTTGTGTDLKISHNSETNLLEHSKQLQFKSTMVDGGGGSNDSYKFLETARRSSVFVFSSDNASGTERPNFYFEAGNETVDSVANSPYMKFRIRSQDTTTGIVNPLEIYQPGQTIATAKVLVNSDLYIPDSRSMFIGDNKDFQIIHTGSTTFIDEQGTGDLFVRSNGAGITMCDTTGTSGNFMARFIKDGAVEVYHNKVKKFETSTAGANLYGTLTTENTVSGTGAGWSVIANSLSVKIEKTNQMFRTYIYINFDGLFSGNATRVIGDNSSGASDAIMQLTTATVGIINKVECFVARAPLGGIADVDLATDASADKNRNNNDSATNILFNAGGNLVAGTSLVNRAIPSCVNQYLYIVAGSGTNTSEYSFGEVCFILTGVAL